MFPILFSIGPLTFKTYGLFVALAFLAAWAILRRHLTKNSYPPLLADRLLFLAVTGGLIGSRALYVLTNPTPWLEIPMIWRGGLSYFGGVLGAGFGIIVFALKKKIRLASLGDAVALGLPIAHAIGRLGCLSAGCCWGRPTKSVLSIVFANPLSVLPPELLGVRLHPTQIYEALTELVIAGILWLLRNRLKGKLLAFYLMLYGISRFFLENLRGDALGEAYILGMTSTQVVIVGLILPSVLLWLFLTRSKPNPTKNR